MIISDSFQYEEVSGFRFGYSPFGKPKLFVHVYYIDGLLIDTGQRSASKHILEATEHLDIDQIFITHHHEDHTGNIPKLHQMHDCKVYAPKMTCEIMHNPPKLSLVQKLTYHQRGPYHELIPISGEIRTKNHQFQIIPIPGHAPDMVALYEPNKKWLFSSDLYINSFIGFFLWSESVKTQIESTRRILQLDFDVLFCAHNPQLRDGKRYLNKKLLFLEAFYEEVSSLHKKGFSAKEIFAKMKLKENWFVRILSGGTLSKLNMVKSVIRDIEKDAEECARLI